MRHFVESIRSALQSISRVCLGEIVAWRIVIGEMLEASVCVCV